MRLYCPTEGNKDRIAYCNQKLVCEDTGETIGDPDSVCDDTTRAATRTKGPGNQGIFVHDTAPDEHHSDGRQDRSAVRRVHVLEFLWQDPLHGRWPLRGRRRGRRRAGTLALLSLRRGLGPKYRLQGSGGGGRGLRVLSQRGPWVGPAIAGHRHWDLLQQAARTGLS